MTRGVILAAPASGSGKTLVTLALLRHFRRSGRAVSSIKVGPDYIDPAFHAAASGRACANLDTWAMRPETLGRLLSQAGRDAEFVLGEGVMGLFDGASGGAGSTADLATALGWPVVLVVDARGMAASAGALLKGFMGFRPGVVISGVIFNRVGGSGHERALREAAGALDLPVLGCIPRDPALVLPERHLGLVQAAEHAELEAFLDGATEQVGACVDTVALAALATAARLANGADDPVVPPLGQRIAVARDEAFAFSYPFLLDGWRAAGAEVSLFSPLADEAPDVAADAVYLPGGYPELHGARLARNAAFLEGLRSAAARGATVFGECGGYMVLGRGLEDGEGRRHAMAGLLPLETSFADPRLTLGYRQAALDEACPLGAAGSRFRGHEFHFARTTELGLGPALFRLWDSAGKALGAAGRREGRVMGSFLHLIDRAP